MATAWEYKTVSLPSGLQAGDAMLTILGRDGWEAYAVVEREAYLKRPWVQRNQEGRPIRP